MLALQRPPRRMHVGEAIVLCEHDCRSYQAETMRLLGMIMQESTTVERQQE